MRKFVGGSWERLASFIRRHRQSLQSCEIELLRESMNPHDWQSVCEEMRRPQQKQTSYAWAGLSNCMLKNVHRYF
jgi:hypothetical protein